MARRRRNWDAISTEILTGLDVRAEYEAMGVNVNGATPNGDGWVSCYAVGREDNHPSAAINIKTGRYKDSGGEGLSLSLWDFSVEFGTFSDWKEARKDFADKAGVSIGRGKPPESPASNLKFQPWNDTLISLWCDTKPGVTPEAIRAAGGRMAVYRNSYYVIALPVFGAAGVNADPIGWVLHQRSGALMPVFAKDGSLRSQKKMKLTYGSQPGLMGFHGLSHVADAEIVWSVEGPTDLLALYSNIPAELRDTHVVVCNANGANETPKPATMGHAFSGKRVRLVRDADTPGQAGATKWAKWIAGMAAEVRSVQLPYEISDDHGHDLRDFFNDGNTYADLLALAEDAAATDVAVLDPGVDPADLSADGPQVIEADDDPHRLARVFIRQHCTHADGLTLRFWRDEWWVWDGRRYQSLTLNDIRNRLIEAIKQEFDRLNLEAQANFADQDEPPVAKKVTSSLVTNVLAALASMVALEPIVEQNEWIDATVGLSNKCLALKNGILDVDRYLAGHDDYFTDHTPAWFSIICMPYPFDPTDDCPTWKKVTHQNLEDDAERINLLQEWAGYLLLPDMTHQKFMFLEGEGANGKSVYCAGLVAILGGTQNTSHVSLEDFGRQYALTPTLGKLANIVAEVGELDKAAEGHLKAFTSGDQMSFERKYLSSVSATPTARLVFSANNRPRFSDKSQGLWRRLLLIPFLREVPEDERIANIHEVSYWLKSAELPGMLNWALAGLHRLRKQGNFTSSEVSKKGSEEYQLEVNPTREFWQDCCCENSLDEVLVDDIYKLYTAWCKAKGCHPSGVAQFGKEGKRVYKCLKKVKHGGRGARYGVYTGITINNEI